MTDADAIDALMNLAQVGVGLVGFSALVLEVTALGTPLAEAHRLQLREVVRVGLAVVAMSFLPYCLALFGLHAELLWRIASGFHLALLAPAAFVLTRETRQVPRDERGGAFAHLISALSICMILAQLANFANWPIAASGAQYFLAMFLGMLVSGAYFLKLLLGRI